MVVEYGGGEAFCNGVESPSVGGSAFQLGPSFSKPLRDREAGGFQCEEHALLLALRQGSGQQAFVMEKAVGGCHHGYFPLPLPEPRGAVSWLPQDFRGVVCKLSSLLGPRKGIAFPFVQLVLPVRMMTSELFPCCR